MTLDKKTDIRLLGEIFMSSLDNFHGVNAGRFRAKHHELRPQLDALESSGYLEKRDGNYRLRLVALREIKDDITEVEQLLSTCESVFAILRKAYIDSQSSPVALNNIAAQLNLSRQEADLAVTYMLNAPIFGGWSNTFLANDEAFVAPREEILDFNSFDEAVEQLREWSAAARHTAERSVPRPFDGYTQGCSVVAMNGFAVPSHINSTQLEGLLHHDVAKYALPHFVSHHFREAVLNSVMVVFDLIRSRTGLKEDGDQLVGKAFALNSPYLVFSELNTESGQNDQKGFIQILKGLYQGVRNPNAHTLNHAIGERDAAQYLVMASLLAQKIDDATRVERG
jgi:uncharacterized protein (TIGR02391 family)